MEEKPIYWVGNSRGDIVSFPEDARRKVGFQLRAVQRGEAPSDFKPMTIIGSGVQEIRIKTENAYRVFYVARFDEAIYILHAFEKKTQKTSKQDIQLGQQRYQEMLEYRKSQLP